VCRPVDLINTVGRIDANVRGHGRSDVRDTDRSRHDLSDLWQRLELIEQIEGGSVLVTVELSSNHSGESIHDPIVV
jgi:hypothetical protein